MYICIFEQKETQERKQRLMRLGTHRTVGLEQKEKGTEATMHFDLNFRSSCFIFLMFKIILNCPFDFS